MFDIVVTGLRSPRGKKILKIVNDVFIWTCNNANRFSARTHTHTHNIKFEFHYITWSVLQEHLIFWLVDFFAESFLTVGIFQLNMIM